MDLSPALPWLSAMALFISLGTAIWSFVQSPAKKNADDLEKVRRDVDREHEKIRIEVKSVDDKTDTLGGRVSTLETVMKHMPDKGDLHRLELSLERMTGHIETLSAKLESVEHLSRRVQTMLVSAGGSGA